MTYNDFTFESLGEGIEICISDEHRFGTDAFLLADFSAGRHKDICADLCTGSGIIALLLHKFYKPQKIYAIYFWEDTAKVLDEVRRVLKDGGNFICTFYTKGYLDKLPYCDTGFDKFTPQQVRSMARERGFHDVKVKILSDCKAYCLVGTKIEGE